MQKTIVDTITEKYSEVEADDIAFVMQKSQIENEAKGFKPIITTIKLEDPINQTSTIEITYKKD